MISVCGLANTDPVTLDLGALVKLVVEGGIGLAVLMVLLYLTPKLLIHMRQERESSEKVIQRLADEHREERKMLYGAIERNTKVISDLSKYMEAMMDRHGIPRGRELSEG